MIKLLGQFKSKKDKTNKWVFENENNEIIEISLISTKTKDIFYVPTHYNCPLGCQNCSLQELHQGGKMRPIEFADLMQAIDEIVLPWDERKTSNTKVIVSFRGVGEPLLNMPIIESMYKGKYNLERLGYTKVGFEISTMMPDENLKLLSQFVQEGKYPLRVIYRLASPLDEKRKKITPSSKLSVDTSLSYVKMFRDELDNIPEYKRMHRGLFGTKAPVEISYSIIPDVNDSLFELANLQYFQSRFDIPVTFLKNHTGEEMWRDDILSHYPEAKVNIERSIGRDIGCEHGEFNATLYDQQTAPDNIENYDSVIKKYLKNREKSVKKILENKVV